MRKSHPMHPIYACPSPFPTDPFVSFVRLAYLFDSQTLLRLLQQLAVATRRPTKYSRHHQTRVLETKPSFPCFVQGEPSEGHTLSFTRR
jgi:hypothetical protein